MRETPRARRERISAVTRRSTSSATTSATPSSWGVSPELTMKPCALRSWLTMPALVSGSAAETWTPIDGLNGSGSATIGRSPDRIRPPPIALIDSRWPRCPATLAGSPFRSLNVRLTGTDSGAIRLPDRAIATTRPDARDWRGDSASTNWRARPRRGPRGRGGSVVGCNATTPSTAPSRRRCSGIDWGRAASVERPANYEETVSPSYPGTHPILRIQGQASPVDVAGLPGGGFVAVGYAPPDWVPVRVDLADGGRWSIHPMGSTEFTFPVAVASGERRNGRRGRAVGQRARGVDDEGRHDLGSRMRCRSSAAAASPSA